MEKFKKLGLGQEILEVLSELRFETPSEIQEKAIPLAMAGNDIIGGSATGSGKTLAFASPIIENLKPNGHVQALILTPTRELTEQVAESIKKFSKNKGLGVLAVYGGVSINRQIRQIQNTDVIVGTPGRILDHLQRATLNLSHVKFLVLDEVDRMFDMGFCRDVEKIIFKCPVERQTMLFSATISAEISYLAKKHTKDATQIAVKSYVDHSKLKQIYYDVEANMKFSLLVHLLKNENAGSVMIFCNTRRNVNFVEKNLKKSGMEVSAIHGGLTQNKRSRIMAEFQKGSVQVLICTDVAARGLDIKGVSHIYNYNIPIVSNDYIHRIGRTARAGNEGIAINLISNGDYENFGNVKQNDLLKIEKVELPVFGRVEVKTDFGSKRFGGGQKRFSRNPNGRRRFSRGRNFSRGRSDSRGGQRGSGGSKDGFRGSRGGRRSSDGQRQRRSFSRSKRNNF